MQEGKKSVRAVTRIRAKVHPVLYLGSDSGQKQQPGRVQATGPRRGCSSQVPLRAPSVAQNSPHQAWYLHA